MEGQGNFGPILTDEELIQLGILEAPICKGSGISAYIPISMLTDAIEYQLKPELKKPIDFNIDDGPSNESFAGAKVGVRYARIALALELNNYRLDTDATKPSRLYLTVLNEKVGGIIGLHIAKEAPFGWGDIHNKVYTINFELRIKNLTFAVDMGASQDGYPKLDIGLSLEGLDVKHDLDYHIHEKDLLTFVAGLAEPFWIGEINKVIRNELLPMLTGQMNQIVNSRIRHLWRNHLDFRNETNFRIHLNIENICTTRRFVRLLVNGHVENRNYLGRTSEKCYISHKCQNLRDVSHLIGMHKKIYVQFADCVLQSALNSYFQNPIEINMPIEVGWFNELKITHKPENLLSSSFTRTQGPLGGGSHSLAIIARGDFEFVMTQKLPIPIHFYANAKIEISEPTYWGPSPQNPGRVCCSFEISKPDIGTILDRDFKPKQLGDKGIVTVLPKLKEKLADIKHVQKVEIDAIPLHDKCWLIPDLMHILEEDILMTLEVVYT